MGRSTVWTSRIRRASSEWERELFVDGMTPEEVRGALYDVTRTIDHLRISLAAVGQVADTWTEDRGRHQESVKVARQRLTAVVEKLTPIAQDLQAAFYAFEDVVRVVPAEPEPAPAAAYQPPVAHGMPGQAPPAGSARPAAGPPGPVPSPPNSEPPRSPVPAPRDTRAAS